MFAASGGIYLTLQIRPGTPLKAADIYYEFRNYFSRMEGKQGVNGILSDLRRFGVYFTGFSLGQEKDAELREALSRLRSLVEVASPVVMTLYDYYDRTKTLTKTEFVEAIELLESFVFRRSVCDMQTRSLGQIFAGLAYRITETQPLLSLKIALYRQGKKRRFPTDAEFREALEIRDIYDMQTCFYLLDRLENFSKERITTMPWAVKVYERIRRRQVLELGRDIHPEDYVFMPEAASRDNAMKLLARQFEIVLEVTGLKLSTAGETRTLYSLRHSSIMFRLMFGRTVDTLTLARNARTSPEMIDRFYAASLQGEMNVGELQSKRRPRPWE